MANAKRASMREGPLAALFRKTEEAEEASATPSSPSPPKRKDPAPPVHPRESGLPHPALGASAPSFEDEVRVPSPKERLRQAFSSDIPENVMERPAVGAVMDDYNRDHPAGAPGPVGQPIIRVVGVGGGGVN